MLAGAVVVERTNNHRRKIVGLHIGIDQPVRSCLGRRVRAHRIQRVVFIHRTVEGGPVNLGGRNMDEQLYRMIDDGVCQHLCTDDIRLKKNGIVVN